MKPRDVSPIYGFDAPGVLRAFYVTGTVSLVLAAFIGLRAPFGGTPSAVLTAVLGVISFVTLFLALAMIRYGLSGKFRVRDRILNQIRWRGDERVLDVGTGAGLLMIGAAKRLKTGRVTGIDIWRPGDLSGNGIERTKYNMALERVADRTEVVTCDATKLDFPDAFFDVIVSLQCLNNLEGDGEKAEALREMARVLKPGGQVVVADYLPTMGYEKTLQANGLKMKRSKNAIATAMSPLWIVSGDKPAASA